MHIHIPDKCNEFVAMCRSKISFQKTLMWPPKATFEFGWRRSWDHKDMCLISYFYCNSKKTCGLSLHIWIVTLEI